MPVRIRGDAWSRSSWRSREHRTTKILLVAKQLWIQDTERILKPKHCPANCNPWHILQEGQTKTISDSALRVSTEDSLWKWRHGTSLLLQRGESPGYTARSSWVQRLLKHISSWNSQYQLYYLLLLLLVLMQCLLSSWKVILYKNKQKCQNKNRCLEQPRESSFRRCKELEA